jgi:GMP synthase (glutamine-hydrolysing)
MSAACRRHEVLGLVEPLRELFKDEVRKIGLELGLPRDMVYRHPFPGPGLGVRILGEVKKEYADCCARPMPSSSRNCARPAWYDRTSQAFAVFLPVKSVGVVGDARRYEWVIALRAVETIDFMTARWAHLPYDFLEKVSNRIINELSGSRAWCTTCRRSRRRRSSGNERSGWGRRSETRRGGGWWRTIAV